MNKNTLVINLFAGPGAGKSTVAAGIFSQLKWWGIDCEMASEFAKDLVWEKRHYTFNNQIYLFGKQHHRVFRLLGQVEVIITDSPILLGIIYDTEKRDCLENLILHEFKRLNSYNIFLRRVKNYNPNGRNQTESEAVEKDEEILRLLNKHNIPFVIHSATQDGIDDIIKYILPSISR